MSPTLSQLNPARVAHTQVAALIEDAVGRPIQTYQTVAAVSARWMRSNWICGDSGGALRTKQKQLKNITVTMAIKFSLDA